MASATPPSGSRSPNKSANGRPRVPVAIPLHYPGHRRGNSKAVSQEVTTPAKSEKSDIGSGDEALAGRHPMTPESLPSSMRMSSELHREVDHQAEAHSETADSTNGIVDAVAMPPLEPQTTIRQHDVTPAKDAEPSEIRPNEDVGNAYAGQLNGVKRKPRSNSRPLRVLQAPPPEFHPSGSPSTPVSAHSTHIDHFGNFYSAQFQTNGYQTHAPQMPPFPPHVNGFSSEAHFQPLYHQPLHMSRTSSHASSAGKPVSGGGGQPMFMPDPAMAMANSLSTQSALLLRDRILRHFDQSTFSDLTIIFGKSKKHERRIPAHTLIVQASPKLSFLMTDAQSPTKTIHITPADHFMTEVGFIAVLKYLYGAQLWSPETLFLELSSLSSDLSPGVSPEQLMFQVLSYTANGHYLELTEVVQAGLECIRRHQSWDTIVPCLAFSLGGGLDSQAWQMDDASTTIVDGKSPASKSQDPTYGQVATFLLKDILAWLATWIPPNFQFAPGTAQLEEAPRLPTVIENRPSHANPRLSLIQFGQLALEETGRPDYVTRLISSTLISLPFPALRYLFEHHSFKQIPLDHLKLAEAVIAEREERRVKVLEAKRVKDGESSALWEATRWKETVVRETEHEFRTFHLHRFRVEDEPKSSSGA